jgi:DNA-binding transcriptional ArsR family regulator
MNANKVISFVTGLLVLALSVISFALSYAALRNLAWQSGAVVPALAWAWPIVIDGAMVVFSMTILRGSLHGERVWYSWALVLVFCALSVGFNIAHAPLDILARLVASVPPVALLLAFESLMSQVKSAVRRRAVSQSLEVMTAAVSSAKSEVAELNRQADDLSARADTLRAEIAELRKVKRAAEREVSPASETARDAASGQFTEGDPVMLDVANATRREIAEARKAQVVSIIGSEQGVTYQAIADRLGVSLATVKRDVAELTEAGKVKRNGHGLEPVSITPLDGGLSLVSEAISAN